MHSGKIPSFDLELEQFPVAQEEPLLPAVAPILYPQIPLRRL